MTFFSKPTILAALLVPAAAVAGLDVGKSVGTTEAEVRSALAEMGYRVHEISIEHDEIEAEATMNGIAYEIEVATSTGLITEIETEDDEYDDGE